MLSFVINGTEFGIDPATSFFRLTSRMLRGPLLDVEINGLDDVFRKLTESESSAWSWALYPPQFYLRAYPIPKPKSGKRLDVRLPPGDLERYDSALYMMNHNRVDDVGLGLMPDTELIVTGKVDLFGEPGEFRIEWRQ